jgi:7-cyano-7-deazaguanine synthase
MDSMALVFYYQAKGAPVEGLFVDYGQLSARREEKAAHAVAEYFKIPLSVARIRGLSPRISEKGFIQGRNMGLALIGLMNSKITTGTIALGIHSGSYHCDCTPEFVKLAQDVFNMYTQGQIRVGAPFVTWDKVDIAIYCFKKRLPRWLTYSCELGLRQPCGKCDSCKALVRLDGR